MNAARRAISNQSQTTRKMLSLAGGIEHIEIRPQRVIGAPPRSQPVHAAKLEDKSAKPEEMPLNRYEHFCTEWFMPCEEASPIPDRPGAI